MASSDNLATIEPWIFRPPLADSWISEAFARDTETLTNALQKSLSSHPDTIASTAAADAAMSSFLCLVKPETLAPASAPAQSGSASDAETVTPRRRSAIPISAKPTKRKSRASKRSTTTFIAADPANFRQMVQQVTGVRFGGGNGPLPVPPLLKPEPQRPVQRMQGCLPTLDTSAFLLDHHHQQLLAGPGSEDMAAASVQPSFTVSAPAMVADGSGGLGFESFSSFPTLESWKVM